jgi:hypothetical protein
LESSATLKRSGSVTTLTKPKLVFHADWGSENSKRWCARATLGADGRYTASGPHPVGDPRSLMRTLRDGAGALESVFAGFDFPIGIPVHFAEQAGIANFRDFLPQLGEGKWSKFHLVCDAPEEISVHRPFYPNAGYKGRSREDLLRGHRVTSLEPLLRQCERGGNGHPQASCLFWTLGGQQVGKAALIGWIDVLVRAIREDSIRIWPFDGRLEALFESGRIVVAETYPAEFYRWFAHTRPVKTEIESRKNFGCELLKWAQNREVAIERGLENAIREGFPKGKDDALDAVVGLFGLLQICLGERALYEPDDGKVREVEGWILGRRSRHVELPEMMYSAATDAELRDWLNWVSETGEVPIFIRTIAEAAFLADLANYALLRPVLLTLKSQSTYGMKLGGAR